VRDAALKAGARDAYLIEEPLAAAIGANVTISGASGNLIIDIGGGTSNIHEAVFEDRIEWLSELRKLGARIDIHDAKHASIHGPARLHGGEASISDLRAGASLILAALAADGDSLIHGAHHVHRGYEHIDRKFQQLGASIVRTADRA
jgi:UDP-N-acetylglucosamine 1-carboxyvinyltransferase